MNEMSEKTYATIYVDKKAIRKAKELGLNISKTCENALKEAIIKLESPNNETNSRFSLSDGSLSTKRESSMDRAVFAPR
jgi:post-segregation antitoxin (ccd killing protein)